ncbi:hypothetical protein D1007_03230 [Hordeum vulgare]|nr:hypothetical protein D1007_03230 [Hordeum vulgare]
MFQYLERRASWALSDICGEGVSSPLVTDNAGYLGFFSRVVECFEAGAEKAHALAEEKSRDLLGQAAWMSSATSFVSTQTLTLPQCWVRCQRRSAPPWPTGSRSTWKPL